MGVFGSQFEDFGADGLTGEFGACVARCVRLIFLANRSKIECGLLVVGVHEQDIGILSGGHAGEVCGDGGLATAPIDAAPMSRTIGFLL